MATAKAKNIEIKPIELEVVELAIKGVTPLIVHAWDVKAKQEMLDKQRGKAKKAKHDVKIPVRDFMNALYWLDGNTFDYENVSTDDEAEQCWEMACNSGAKFGFPVTGIKQSIIMGAKRGGLDVVATELRASFFLEGGTPNSTVDLAEIVTPEPPIMREDMVRVGGMSKTADIRHRPEFRDWHIPLKLTYNKNGKYSLEQIMNCVNVGGFACGIGEWRPEKDGQFGMYTLES